MKTDKALIANEQAKNTPVQFGAKDVELESKTTLFQGFFKLVEYRFKHRLFAGGWSAPVERELFERGSASALLAYDIERDRVVLVEQIRVGALESDAPWQLEIIAGMDDGQAPEEVVIKEAKEEAGLTVKDVQLIRQFYSSSGGCSEKLSIFLGLVDSSEAQGIHGLAEENEDIKVHVMSRREAFELVEQGVIENASTIIALQWLELNFSSLKLQRC